ncbi:MAG TPA: hypothetical protein VG796_02280 [Verrucomicrobiales bacterium]|jgi:hypothetical protein|nr:hypothetical protein [Verrucomicrobiales bacterium]
MKTEPVNDPQPISLEDAKRIWTLQKQNAPLSPEDQALLHQAFEWQMWVSHGIRLKNSSSESPASSAPSGRRRKKPAVC